MLNQRTVYSCSHPEKQGTMLFLTPEMAGMTIRKTGYALGIRLETGLNFY